MAFATAPHKIEDRSAANSPSSGSEQIAAHKFGLSGPLVFRILGQLPSKHLNAKLSYYPTERYCAFETLKAFKAVLRKRYKTLNIIGSFGPFRILTQSKEPPGVQNGC